MFDPKTTHPTSHPKQGSCGFQLFRPLGETKAATERDRACAHVVLGQALLGAVLGPKSQQPAVPLSFFAPMEGIPMSVFGSVRSFLFRS